MKKKQTTRAMLVTPDTIEACGSAWGGGMSTGNDYPLWLRAAAQMLRENDPTLRGVANTCEGAADAIATLQRELEEARAELDITSKLLDARNEVMALIPGCPVHGEQCVPHAKEWIASIKSWKESIGKEMSGWRDVVLNPADLFTVINNNQPGWTMIIETQPYVTVEVGGHVYSKAHVLELAVALTENKHLAEHLAAKLVEAHELLERASPYLHDIPEASVGGSNTAVALAREIRAALAGQPAPKVSEPLTAAEMYPGRYMPGCTECAGMGCDACAVPKSGEHENG